MNEEFARIRGYLQSQAAKMTLAQLIDKVRTDLAQLDAAIAAFPAARWQDRPAEGEWSANEVAAHLADSSRGVARSIVSVVREGARPGAGEDVMRHTDEGRSPRDWWETIRSDREQLFADLATATGGEHLDVGWGHPMFGDLNWREWLLFMRIHDLDHARQIQSIAEAFEKEAVQ